MASYPIGNEKKVVVISALHIVTAALLFITGILQLGLLERHWSSQTGLGLWGGAWVFVTGFVGFLSARRNAANIQHNACYIATYMAFSIVATVYAAIFLIVFGVAMAQFNACLVCESDDSDDFGIDVCYIISGLRSKDECKIAKGLGAFTLALLLFEFILSILSAIFCCSAVCCGPREVVLLPPGGGVVQVQEGAVVGQTRQVTCIQQGQVPMVMPGANVPPTMQVVHSVQQVPQYYPQQQVQVPTPQQGWHQAPPPAYSVPMATGVTPSQGAEPLPQKN